ncbi:4'-phosphopantetheinyl transferase superfamily protein [Deinococcus pimensis]|uniref:4'-phosphopantetheinyl transferase superfamily protein n=1 Tax=Deinococcus pimensis TaxID=309888 RepID=UPI0004874BB1|nr:4'-phosphopantetheinyl transferase superfamily protein [Deinococcus pimensis]
MIVAVGHDLIEIERIRRARSREGERFLRLFHEEELAYCARFVDPTPSLAARFAAKEAFQKVWPRPHGWADVWVRRDPTPQGPFPFTRPYLRFCDEIDAELRGRGLVAHLTMTHTKEHASAVVILEER